MINRNRVDCQTIFYCQTIVYSVQVDQLGLRYRSVYVGAGKGPGGADLIRTSIPEEYDLMLFCHRCWYILRV